MKISKKENVSTRTERKSRKRKLEGMIPDLPGDCEDAVIQGSSESDDCERYRGCKGDHTAIRNAPRAQARGSLKDASEGRRKIKMSRADMQNRGFSEVRLAKPTKLEEILSSGKFGGDGSEAQLDEKSLCENNFFSDPLSGNQAATLLKSKTLRKAERKAAESLANNITKSTIVQDVAVISPVGDSAGRSKQRNRARKIRRECKARSFTGGEFTENVEKKSSRFIVFIGNLPFSATTRSIMEHFAAVKPISVRHLTIRGKPTLSKGCAFVEFEAYDYMKSCLRLFHHSTFDDGISPPRRINVELTAGGGGKSKHRQAKISEKNQKLNEERVRRLREERVKLVKKDMTTIHYGEVHPSRRAQVPGVQS